MTWIPVKERAAETVGVTITAPTTIQWRSTLAATHTYTPTCAGHHPLTEPCPAA